MEETPFIPYVEKKARKEIQDNGEIREEHTENNEYEDDTYDNEERENNNNEKEVNEVNEANHANEMEEEEKDKEKAKAEETIIDSKQLTVIRRQHRAILEVIFQVPTVLYKLTFSFFPFFSFFCRQKV